MLRILTLLATVATALTLSGGANAHPPDLYDTAYGAPVHVAPHRAGAHHGARVQARSAYDATPVYSKIYTTPTYRAPTYRAPAYRAPVPYRPAYRTVPVGSYAGYTNPGYGYRHRRAHVRPRSVHGDYMPLRPRYRARSPHAYVPMTESVAYGYSGGPTFGDDVSAVINGVRVFRERD